MMGFPLKSSQEEMPHAPMGLLMGVNFFSIA
jgi:hypothetical protein